MLIPTIRKSLLFVFLLGLVFTSCEEEPRRITKNKPKPTQPFVPIAKPVFNGDNAYNYVQKQVDFGPRVPGTSEHKACAEYLEKELKSFGLQTTLQVGKTTSFDGVELPVYNITGKYDPENLNRIMLFAHWDTRPFADRDTKDKGKPILGANDGGSGVGVILELVRAIMQDSLKPKVGIDFVFFDVEDYGKTGGSMTIPGTNTWCLGSQYWASNLEEDFIKPKYGVLLDMVGAKDAVFPIEEQSKKFNSPLVSKVWYLAGKLGYGNYFIQELSGGVTDDHVQVSLVGIPSIDIIHYDPYKRDFGHFHHRHSDNMDVINKNTLKAVGETMLELIYREK
jgi:Zn-dependent M28 family amino/carboxypeptidase